MACAREPSSRERRDRSVMASSVEEVPTRAVGPYLMQRTLGKGQTGTGREGGEGGGVGCPGRRGGSAVCLFVCV